MRTLGYIAGKYADGMTIKDKDVIRRNVMEAEKIGALLLKHNILPIIPHKITMGWEDFDEFKGWTHEKWLKEFCYPLIHRCDLFILAPNWIESKGAKMEVIYAHKIGKPIFEIVGKKLFLREF